jgi:hypothetical protein
MTLLSVHIVIGLLTLYRGYDLFKLSRLPLENQIPNSYTYSILMILTALSGLLLEMNKLSLNHLFVIIIFITVPVSMLLIRINRLKLGKLGLFINFIILNFLFVSKINPIKYIGNIVWKLEIFNTFMYITELYYKIYKAVKDVTFFL